MGDFMNFDGKKYLESYLDSMHLYFDKENFIKNFGKLFESNKFSVNYGDIKHVKKGNTEYLLIHPHNDLVYGDDLCIDEMEIGNRMKNENFSSTVTLYVSGHFKDVCAEKNRIRLLVNLIKDFQSKFSLSVINEYFYDCYERGFCYFNSDDVLEFYDGETLDTIKKGKSDKTMLNLISFSPEKLKMVGFLPDYSKKIDMDPLYEKRMYRNTEDLLVQSLLYGSLSKFYKYLDETNLFDEENKVLVKRR